MRPVRKADNLTTILCRCQEIWEPQLRGTLWATPQACNEPALTFLVVVSSSSNSGGAVVVVVVVAAAAAAVIRAEMKRNHCSRMVQVHRVSKVTPETEESSNGR
jgi:hypothetical protein